MTGHHHKPSPPNETKAPVPPASRRRLGRGLLFGLLIVFAVIVVIAVLQVMMGSGL